MSGNVVIEQRCLTWNELARLYNDANGYQEARTKPSGTIMNWALAQKDRFLVNDDGVHLLVTK
jgi:hypothetical protein